MTIYLTESEILNEDSQTKHITFYINKGKTKVNIFVRNKEGAGREGSISQHGPSFKVKSPLIADKEIAIGITGNPYDPIKLIGDYKDAEKELNNKYKGIKDFAILNSDYFMKIFKTDNKQEFDNLISQIINDKRNEEYKVSLNLKSNNKKDKKGKK